MNFNGGLLTNSDTFYVLVETDECEDDEAIICSGQLEDSQIVLSALTPKAEFVSMKELTGSWRKAHEVAAVTAQGEMHYLNRDAAEFETIPGTGNDQPDSAWLGRLTSVKQVGEHLFALGYGGQVYRRTLPTEWQATHVPRKSNGPKIDACLYDVVLGSDGNHYFGGTDITKFERTPELIAADEADDEELWLELLLAAPSGDQMSLRRFDGAWHDLGMPYDGAINVIIETDKRVWTLFSNRGTAWRTEDFLAIEETVVLEDGKKFWDIKEIGEGVYILVGQLLNQLVDDELVAVAPPIPFQDDGYTNVSGNAHTIVGFHADGVTLLRDREWSETIPMIPGPGLG